MNIKIKKTCINAMLFCLGIVLPFWILQIPQLGNMLLPMHLPVFLGGLICGPVSAAALGLLLPLTRSIIFGMPSLYPTAIAMSFELFTYGLCCGLIYKKSKKKNTASVYAALVSSMILGRLVWGLLYAVLLGVGEKGFTLSLFVTEGFINAIPGIILQLTLIPLIIVSLKKIGFLPLEKNYQKDIKNEQQ